MMEPYIQLSGIFLVILALIHIDFPNRFQWKNELQSLSLINRQMMQIHTFFIALTVGLMGILSFAFAFDICHTPLGKYISLGMGIFWTIRLFFQWFVYSMKLWKGKTFETSMHVIFTALWIFLSVIHWVNFAQQ